MRTDKSIASEEAKAAYYNLGRRKATVANRLMRTSRNEEQTKALAARNLYRVAIGLPPVIK